MCATSPPDVRTARSLGVRASVSWMRCPSASAVTVSAPSLAQTPLRGRRVIAIGAVLGILMLEGLYPGRVDLGLGRSVGFTAPVRRALGRPGDQPDTFVDDIAELRSYLERTAPVTARPVARGLLPIFLLATGRGMEIAARLGLPVVLGGPVLSRPELGDLLAAYRRDFRPHRDSRSHVTVSIDVLVADTDAEARELALSEVWAMVRSRRTGVFGPLEPVASIRDQRWDDQDADRVARPRGGHGRWAGHGASPARAARRSHRRGRTARQRRHLRSRGARRLRRLARGTPDLIGRAAAARWCPAGGRRRPPGGPPWGFCSVSQGRHATYAHGCGPRDGPVARVPIKRTRRAAAPWF